MTALGRAIFQASWKVPSLPAASITASAPRPSVELLDAGLYVLLFGVDEHIGPAVIQRELAALVMAVHRDDAGGLEQPGAHHGSIAAGAAAENHHGVPFLDLSQLRAKIAGEAARS